MPIYPGMRQINKQDRFTSDMPYVILPDLWREKIVLRKANAYAPLRVRLKLLNTKLSAGKIAVEQAKVEDITFMGVKKAIFESEGFGGRLFGSNNNFVRTQNPVVGLDWKATGFALAGSTTSGVISSNKVTLKKPEAYTEFTIVANPDDLVYPLFRIRRAYATVATAVVLGVGDGSTTEFNYTVPEANRPICPSSVKINFTDGGGAKTGKIRDNGRGLLTNLPPDILLKTTKQSTIDYKTGKIFLAFDAGHVPTATNITIDLEHGSIDQSMYRIEWDGEIFGG